MDNCCLLFCFCCFCLFACLFVFCSCCFLIEIIISLRADEGFLGSVVDVDVLCLTTVRFQEVEIAAEYEPNCVVLLHSYGPRAPAFQLLIVVAGHLDVPFVVCLVGVAAPYSIMKQSKTVSEDCCRNGQSSSQTNGQRRGQTNGQTSGKRSGQRRG